jgi:hypothetical protein
VTVATQVSIVARLAIILARNLLKIAASGGNTRLPPF